MAALIEYVCTAQHERREEPAVTWQRGSWAYCSWGAENHHQWTRIDPTAIETLRSPAGNGHPRLVPAESAGETSSRRRKR